MLMARAAGCCRTKQSRWELSQEFLSRHKECVFRGGGGVWRLYWPIFGGFFGREETFVQHKYAMDLNSIFPNLSLLVMLLQAVPYHRKNTVDFWFPWKCKRSRFFVTETPLEGQGGKSLRATDFPAGQYNRNEARLLSQFSSRQSFWWKFGVTLSLASFWRYLYIPV